VGSAVGAARERQQAFAAAVVGEPEVVKAALAQVEAGVDPKWWNLAPFRKRSLQYQIGLNRSDPPRQTICFGLDEGNESPGFGIGRDWEFHPTNVGLKVAPLQW
jgi:myo-inositol catabolism protein IolC